MGAMSTGEQIGREVKRLREKAGLNQTQIATFLGLDQTTVSKCESGERQFTVDALEKLCALFGCSMDNLLGQDAHPQTLNFAFRADTIDEGDLDAISDINRIALNIVQMKQLLEG
jgi:transcriptional regulator with XRE-family HTH domain